MDEHDGHDETGWDAVTLSLLRKQWAPSVPTAAALGVAGVWVGITGFATLYHREEEHRHHPDIEAHGAPTPPQRFIGRAALESATTSSAVGSLAGLSSADFVKYYITK